VIGQQTTLTLRVEGVGDAAQQIGRWFQVPDTFNHVEVIRKTGVEQKSEAGFSVYEQQVVLTSFDSGSWQLPRLTATIRSVNQRQETLLETVADSLAVLPANITDLQDYHPIKEIIIPDRKPPLWLVAAIVTLVALLIFGGIWLYKRLNKKKPAAGTGGRDAAATARAKLHELETQLRSGQLQNREFYYTYHHIMRTYIGHTLLPGAQQQTTDELMPVIQTRFGNNLPVYTQLYQSLRLSDAVKFARFNPPPAEATAALAAAEAFIQFVAALNNSVHA
jgi:hypothetical protein